MTMLAILSKSRSSSRLGLQRRLMSTTPGSCFLNKVYEVFMRRNAVYITSILAAGVIGEQIFDSAFDKFWAYYNQGKSFEDMIVKFQDEAVSE